MVDQVAGLTLGVDVSQVDKATKSLKDFRQANSETAGAVEDLALAQSIANAKAKEASNQQRRNAEEARDLKLQLQGVINAIDPTASKLQKLADASKNLDKAWSKGLIPDDEFFRLSEILETQNNKLIQTRRLMTEAGRANEEARVAAQKQVQQEVRNKERAIAAEEAAARKAANAGSAFIQSLENQVAAIGKTRQELLELKAAQLGVTAQASPLIEKLNSGLEKQSNQMRLAGMSAGEYRQAMRYLPAQISDVASQLAAGAPFWTIFIQQGGQIKDSFGGVGNVIDAAREGIVNYISSITELKEAFSDVRKLGEEAITRFGRAVTLVGGGAAAAIAGIGYAAYSAYSDIQGLNAILITSGGYAIKTAAEFDEMSGRIAESSQATGGAIEDIMKALLSSGKYTTKQIELITKATADWATATGEDSGKIIGFFDKIAKDPVKGLAELNQQFNFLEKGQLTYISNLEKTQGKTVAANAATEIFANTMQQRMKDIADSANPLDKMWQDIKKWSSDAWQSVSQGFLGGTNLIIDVVAGTVEQIKIILNEGDILIGNFVIAASDKLKNIPGLKNVFGDIAAQQREVVAQAKAANVELAKSVAERDKRIAQGEKGYIARMKEQSKARAGYSQETKDAVEKEAEGLKKTNKEKAKSVDQGDRMSEQYQADIVALQAQLQVLKEHTGVNDKISQQQKTYWNDVAKFQILEQAAQERKLTKQEQQLLAQKDEILNFSRIKADLGNQIQQQETLNKLKQDSEKYVNQIQAKTQAMNETMALSTKEQQRQAELAQITADWQSKGGDVGDLGLQDKLAATREFWSEQDAMSKNWQAGLQHSFAEWGDQVNDVYTNIGEIGTSALNGLASQMTNFLMTGKASFDDFAKSIIADIVQMTIKMALFNAISGFMGGFGFGGGASAGKANGGVVGNASFATGGYTGDGGKYQPAGVVHKGEFVFTKEATKRLGVANLQRLMRGYANGGQVGGNYQSGAGSSGGVMLAMGDVSVVMPGGGDAKSMEAGVRQIVSEVLTRECAQGGQIYRLIKG